MMDASYASAVLRISSDDSSSNLEQVAVLTFNDTNTSRVEAMRADKTPIFPDPSRGNRYLMDFIANRSLTPSDQPDSQREISRMQLVWNGKTNYKKVIFYTVLHRHKKGFLKRLRNEYNQSKR